MSAANALVRRVSCGALLLATTLTACDGPRLEERTDWVQVGGMHETIGQQQHEGRLSLEELAGRPHFYGVGALEGLRGELTVLDSETIATAVGPDGAASPATGAEQATMIVGRSVTAWHDATQSEAVAPESFDATVREHAARAGVDTERPFVFLVEGEFTDVRLHVLNGACPIHARVQDIELPPDRRPFEWSGASLTGTLVAIYAEDAVGTLTHPATSVHGHLVYDDPATGQPLTAHVERMGLAAGARFRLPDDGS